MTTFIHMFPAAYSDKQECFRVCRMESMSYGAEYGDPSPVEARFDPERVPHRRVMDRFLETRIPALTYLLGTEKHGITHNPPTVLAVFFRNEEDKALFLEGL